MEQEEKTDLSGFLVIDALGGTIGSLTPTSDRPLDYGSKITSYGIDCVNLTLGLYSRDIKPLLTELFDFYCLFEQVPDKVVHIQKSEDIKLAKETKRLGIIMSVQGLEFIGDDTRLISIIHRLGIRMAQLTYNERNLLGCGCLERNDDGLTLLGQRVVQELNRFKIIIDLSHAGLRTSLELLEVTSHPAIASHSNAYSLTPNPRNLRDEQIKAIAKSGGLIGISPYSPFLPQSKEVSSGTRRLS